MSCVFSCNLSKEIDELKSSLSSKSKDLKEAEEKMRYVRICTAGVFIFLHLFCLFSFPSFFLFILSEMKEEKNSLNSEISRLLAEIEELKQQISLLQEQLQLVHNITQGQRETWYSLERTSNSWCEYV